MRLASITVAFRVVTILNVTTATHSNLSINHVKCKLQLILPGQTGFAFIIISIGNLDLFPKKTKAFTASVACISVTIDLLNKKILHWCCWGAAEKKTNNNIFYKRFNRPHIILLDGKTRRKGRTHLCGITKLRTWQVFSSATIHSVVVAAGAVENN